jgi:hypothetical protein
MICNDKYYSVRYDEVAIWSDMMPLFTRQSATFNVGIGVHTIFSCDDGADLEARPVGLTRGTGLQDLKRWPWAGGSRSA